MPFKEGHKINLGKACKLETIEKIKKTLLEHYKNNQGQFAGRTHKESTKQKMRDYRIGKSTSPETRKKQSIIKLNYFKINVSHSKGRTLSAEHIQKIKNARAKQITPIKDTSIEIKIQNFLKGLDIDFITHNYMKIKHGYQCDIFIPSMNLVIECDGDYWHNYPVGLDKDHIRTRELIENGFKVLRLWERDINKMELEDMEREINNLTKLIGGQ